MVNWKLYIDAPQQRALDACYCSLTEGDAYGCGMGSGWCDDNGYCNGRSSTEW